MINQNFSNLKKRIELTGWDEKEDTVSISRHAMSELLSLYVSTNITDFDEDWYKRTYPDVSKAVKNGIVKSAKEHFFKYGFFEDRLPSIRKIDIEKYLRKNPDVNSKFGHLNKKERKLAVLKHIVDYGYSEGRQIQ